MVQRKAMYSYQASMLPSTRESMLMLGVDGPLMDTSYQECVQFVVVFCRKCKISESTATYLAPLLNNNL